jgi:hypothetical protein
MPFYDEEGNIVKGQEQQAGTFYDAKGNVMGQEPPPSEGNFITNLARGLYTGVTRRVPEQIGQAMQFAGVAPESGKALADWATEGEPEREKGMFEQAGEMMPLSAALPLAGAAIGLIPTLPTQIIGKTLQYGTPLLFGLSQAQQTREEAQKRGVDEGMAPYATGGIEVAGETIANIALGRLFGSLGGAVKEGVKTLSKTVTPTLGRFVKELTLKTLPTEILTEMGQNYGEAMVEKKMGIRPEADPLQEAIGAIGPTAIMTIATGGLARPASVMMNNHILKTLGDPNTDPEKRLQYANSITRMLNEDYKDPELAKQWEEYAVSRIKPEMFGLEPTPKPIDMNMMMDKESLAIQQMQDDLAKELGAEDAFTPPPAPEQPALMPSSEEFRQNFTAQETGLPQEITLNQSIFTALENYDTVPKNMIDAYFAQGGTIPPNRPDLVNEYPGSSLAPAPEEIVAAPQAPTQEAAPTVQAAPPQAARPSPVQLGRKVQWTDRYGVNGRGRVIDMREDVAGGMAKIRLDQGFGGAEREVWVDKSTLQPINIQESTPERAMRQLAEYRAAQAKQAQGQVTPQPERPIGPPPIPQRQPEAPQQPATPAITGTPTNPSQFLSHIEQATDDEDRIDRAGRIAMQYPDAATFASDLQTAGVTNQQFRNIMGATPQEFFNFYRETDNTKAEQYRREWTEQRAREEGFPEEGTLPRGKVKKEKLTTYYRGGPESAMPKGTAQDVINYETKELGNKINVEPNIDLNTIPAKNLQWVTETKEQAREYGKTGPVEVAGHRVIARDNYGGLLIETTPEISPALQEFMKKREQGILPRAPLKKQGELMPDALRKSQEARAIKHGFKPETLPDNMLEAANKGDWDTFWKLFDKLSEDHQTRILLEEVPEVERGEESIKDIEVEQTRRERAAAIREKRMVYQFGKPIEEVIGHTVKPDPDVMTMIIAEKYSTPEQFEAEWNPKVIDDLIKNSPWAKLYGASREPAPIARAHEVIQAILNKYNTTIEEVKKVEEGKKEREDVIPDDRAYEVLRQHLVALDGLLAANWSLNEDVDYKQLWQDVHDGKKFEPTKPSSDKNLNKYFQGEEKKGEGKRFKMAPPETKAKQVQTVEEFLKVLPNERWTWGRGERLGEREFKPDYRNVDYLKMMINNLFRGQMGGGTLPQVSRFMQDKLFTPAKTVGEAIQRIVDDSPDRSIEGNVFKNERMAKTDSVRPEVVQAVRGYLDGLGLKNLKVMVAAASDLINNKDTRKAIEKRYNLTGWKRSFIFNVARQVQENDWWAATHKTQFGDNERFIVMSDDMMKAWESHKPEALEDLAHETGHIIRYELFDHAKPAVKDAIMADYWAWHKKLLEGGTIGDYLAGVGTPFRERTMNLTRRDKADLFTTVKDWKRLVSFDEWFADQVSRWVSTNEKPKTLTEKFFAKVADMFKKLWRMVDRDLYRPAQSVEKWLDSMWKYDEAKGSKYDALGGLPLFNTPQDAWRQVGQEGPAIKGGDWIATAGNFNDTAKTFQAEVDKGNIPPLSGYDPIDWHNQHAGQSIEFINQKAREDIQESEQMLDDDVAPKIRLDKHLWKNVKRVSANYGIMPSKDMTSIEFMLANPFMLSYRYPDVKKALFIETSRNKNRTELMNEMIASSEVFLKLKRGSDTLKNVEKAVIQGDRELRDEVAKLKEGNDADKALAAEIERLNGYTDQQLVDKFGLSADGIAAYRQVRSTLDAIHKRWLNQIENNAFTIYRNQKWYALLKQLHGSDLNDDELRAIKDKLGPLYNAWNKTLQAAKTPLQNLLQTTEDLEKLEIKAADIMAKAQEDIDANRRLSDAEIATIIRKAEAKVAKMRALAEPELNKEQIARLISSYRKQYNKTKNQINELRDAFREIFGMGEGITDQEVNEELRGLIHAYGKTKPQMAELKRIRNELNKWLAYFPRMRDDTKLHYVAVKQNVRDEDGKVVGSKTLYLNYFNIGAIGGKKLKAEVERLTKELGWTDLQEIEIDRTTKESESTFFRVSEMNTQRIIDKALEAAYHKGERSEKDATSSRSILLHNIADVLNERAFGRHRLHRALDTVLGYKEEDLQNVLLEYIRGYAGMETKQIASMNYTDLIRDMGTDNPKVKDYIYKYSENSLRNQEKLDRIIGTAKGIAFGYYLGLNPKSVLVQLTQNIITGAPIMAQIIRQKRKDLDLKSTTFEAERRLSAAAKDIALGKLSESDRKYLDEQHNKGVTMDQFIEEATGRVGNSMGAWFDRTLRVMSYFFSKAEIFNRQVAGLAMYRFLNDVGLTENAEAEAEHFINRTHYLMGKANLPAPMMGGEPTAQALRGLYTFRSFTHNYLLSMMPGRIGGLGGYGGDARTALHSLAYIALLGGMLALPWVKDLFDWWEKKTGNDVLGSVKKELRKYGGKTLERFGMNGLAGLALGDISGSLGIGIPFVGEPSDSVYGVWAGAARKGAYSAEAFGKGDWYRGVENISPEVMANIMRSLRMSEFGKDIIGTPGYATTRGGRPIFDENGRPMSMSTEDMFRKMIGFQPTEYAERMEQQRTMKNIEAVYNEKRKDIYETYKIAKSKNDPKALKELMDDIKEFNAARKAKGIEDLVAPIKLSNVLKAARPTPTRKERRESRWKYQQTME